MYRAHCCEQYRGHHRTTDPTVLKQIAVRFVEQFRGDVPADRDLTIAEARARQWDEARRMAARREPGNWSVAVSYVEPDEQNALFDGTFADVRRDAQRRRSAYLGSLIAQLFRRRNDADLRTAGDSRLRTSDVG